MLRALCLALCIAGPAGACEVALVLAIDTSGSVDAAEYRLQAAGTGAALADPAVGEALAQGASAVTVVHWSGAGEQSVVLPWTGIASPEAAARAGAAAARAPRTFVNSDTALGDALAFAVALLAEAPPCRRRVIDISGDGPENAGTDVAGARRAALAAGIEINAIAIEDPGLASPVTAFFARHVIAPGGFVVTTRGMGDYAATLRRKLLRELRAAVG